GVGARALLTDALGSTVALGDGTGSLVTQYTYEPFGYTTESGSASTNSYKYTGREDDGSGLLHYRARYYHPRLQRFISEDPIGFDGGSFNLYNYVDNNPIRWVDPLGLEKGGKLSPRCLTLRAAVIISCKAPTSCNSSDTCEVLRAKEQEKGSGVIS
ncbi:MAG: RHS repeat-associated core domain-containing protein, partial [Nitrospira sp.]|nr:RHS repeat-associated core domain-containing protein [Nitrospira sp.]